MVFQLGTVDFAASRRLVGFDAQRIPQMPVGFADCKCATLAKKRTLAGRQALLERRTRGDRQRADWSTPIMCQPESGRAPGGMHGAMFLGFEDCDTGTTGDASAQARSGDPAADDDDVKISHFARWLRIGKPRRLVVAVMFNPTFTDLLLVALAAILVVAAAIDVRTFPISNRLNLTFPLGAPLYCMSIALAPWPGMAIQLAAGGIVFALLAGAFYAGMMSGGDVKLAAALGLWFSPGRTVKFLVLMSLAGG